MHRRIRLAVALAGLLAVALVTASTIGAAPRTAAKKPYKIFVALSYSGNAWQNEAANLALAIARTPPYNKEVVVEKQIAGTDVQAQISQYQSMISAGANAIVSFPVSPTALNSTIRQGCARGVKFVMYDATVTEPCAWNVSYITGAPPGKANLPFFGAAQATNLVNLLHGKGNIFMSRGVPGNSVDETHYDSAIAVFKKHPGIHILATYYGMWDGPTTQKETAKALAAHPDVDGVWAEAGEDGVIKALQQAHHKPIPVVGENSNGFRLALHGGWPGFSSGSPPMTAGIAMKMAVTVLEHGDNAVPKDVELHLPWVPAKAVKVCTGSRFVNGCNAFPASTVPDEFVDEIFDPTLLPESSLSAAETGKPTPGMRIHPLPKDMGPWTQPPSRRYVTRGYCDKGWTKGTLPSGVTGCVAG